VTDKPPAWAVRCPWCGAAVGSRCTSPRGRKLTIDTHDARTTAWTTTRHQQTGETP